jgi:hypothetical protein
MADLIGLDAKLYRGTAGSTAATPMTNVRKVKLNREKAEANLSRRGSRFNLSKSTMKTISVEFEMVGSDTDADLAAIRAAWEADTPLAFKIVDKTGGRGVDADFEIFKFDRDEDEEKEQVYAVILKPTYVSRYPAEV